MHHLALVSAALAASVATPPILAQGPVEAPTAHVSYADLNLRTEEGVAKLDRRIHRAVTRLCAAEGIAALRARVQIRKCRETASLRAQPQKLQAIAAARRAPNYAAR